MWVVCGCGVRGGGCVRGDLCMGEWGVCEWVEYISGVVFVL